MSSIAEKLHEIRKSYPAFDLDKYQHFTRDRAGISGYVLRILSELHFAEQMCRYRPETDSAPVLEAADLLLSALKREGVITKTSAERAEKILLPLQEAAKSYTVHMVAHAHIDMNWMWPWHETVSVTVETFRTMLRLMREDPEFTFSQSQASVYRIVEQFDREMLREIKNRIHEGRWEVTASTWVEADKNMPDLNSMENHLLYTKEYLSELLEIDPGTLDLDFEPDTFGHSACVPEILSRGGVKYYYHCRGYEEECIYRWQAPSGAEVLVYRDPSWYLSDGYPGLLLNVPEFCARYGISEYLRVYGVGDHGGGPTRRDLSYIHEMQTWPVFPTIRFSSYHAFYRYLEGQKERFPVVCRELNPVFTGCYTTQARTKMANRLGEAVLSETQTLDAAAKIVLGRPSSGRQLAEGWKNILFNQFHDILPGSGVRDTREFAMTRFSETLALSGCVEKDVMLKFAEAIDTSSFSVKNEGLNRSEGAGVGFTTRDYFMPPAEQGGALCRLFHIFNPYAEERCENVKLTVWDWPGETSLIRVTDAESGRELPSQLLTEKEKNYYLHTYTEVLAEVKLPPLGYTTILLQEGEEEYTSLPQVREPRTEQPPEYVLENRMIRAEFDRMNGSLVSLKDKRSREEFIKEPAGFRNILEQSTDMPAWLIGKYVKDEAMTSPVRMTGITEGPLETFFEMQTEFGNGSLLCCRISLKQNARFLTFETTVDYSETGNMEKGVPAFQFRVPFAYESPETLYDIPGGFILRAPAAMDLPAQSFAAPVKRNGQPGLILSSDCKYGYRTFSNAVSVSLLRASFGPDPYSDRGEHRFSIFLHVPERTDYRSISAQVRFAARPLLPVSVTPSKGTLPLSGSFLKLQGSNVLLTGMKTAEDGMGLILRLLNPGKIGTAATLRLFRAPALATRTDLLEQPTGENVVLDGRNVTVEIEAGQTASLRLVF